MGRGLSSFSSFAILDFSNLFGFGLQVNIRSIDEAIVIGAALSLSSSAFVLQVCILFRNYISNHSLKYRVSPCFHICSLSILGEWLDPRHAL